MPLVTSRGTFSLSFSVSCSPISAPIKNITANLVCVSSLEYFRTTKISLEMSSLGIDWQPNEQYSFILNPGLATDNDQGFDSIEQTVSYTTNNPPEIIGFYPSVSDPSFTWKKINKLASLIYSNSPMKKSSGNIKLYKDVVGGDDELLYTYISPTDPKITAVDNRIDINTLGLIEENSTYYIMIDDNTAVDEDNFPALGVNDSTTIRFSTDSINFPGLNANLEMNSILSDIGGRIRNNIITSTSDFAMYTIGNRSRILSSVLESTMSITADLTFKITLNNISVSTYITNYNNQLFPTTYLNDRSPGTSYTVNISSPNGKFGPISGGIDNYSFSGDLTQINNNFSQVYFWPTKNYTGSTSYTISILKDGNTVVSLYKILTHSSTNNIGNVYTFTNNSTWTPTALERYYAKMDFLIVGGGGAGGQSVVGSNTVGAGGGGAGEVVYSTMNSINNISYLITVGTAGTWISSDRILRSNAGIALTQENYIAPSGTYSSFNNLTASGGSGGQGSWWFDQHPQQLYGPHPNGGNSPSWSGGTGRTIVNNTDYDTQGNGGGGGGSSDFGGNAANNHLAADLAKGGLGTTINISGGSVEYAHGGDGGLGTGAPSYTLVDYATYGSGGRGSGVVGPTAQNGQPGIVIIKVYL